MKVELGHIEVLGKRLETHGLLDTGQQEFSRPANHRGTEAAGYPWRQGSGRPADPFQREDDRDEDRILQKSPCCVLKIKRLPKLGHDRTKEGVLKSA